MSKVVPAALAAVVALTLAGCGGGSGASGTSAKASPSQGGRHTSSSPAGPGATASRSSEDAKASDAIAHSFMASPGSGGGDGLLGLDRKDARCIGLGVVDKLGIRKLEKYGVLSKHLNGKGSVDQVQLSPADARTTTAVLFTCADVTGMIWKAVGKGGQVPVRVRPCVRKALGEDNLRPVFVSYFEGRKQVAQKSLVRPIMACAHATGG
jgi:hypothetical protein